MTKRIGSVLQPGTYLALEAEQLNAKKALSKVDFKASEWVLEPLGIKDTYRIRHAVQTEKYLHVERGSLACEPIHLGANSSYWILESLDTLDTFTLRNFWRINFYIHQQDDQVLAGPADPQLLQTHWHLEDVGINFLMVPVHLDALWLSHDQAVSAPLADFSRLPYSDGRRDINANTANISEEILTPALQPPQLYLKSGLHLHWALPDALHHGVQQQDQLHFFRAPDRWLITKTVDGVAEQWVVESNYLHPPGERELEAAISYPHKDTTHPQPFRYLGRRVPLSEWVENDASGTNTNYLHTLTAMGYGEPTFAAFYPNCHSVFGFYDKHSANKSIQEMKGVRYELIGWHSSAGSDVLQDSRFQAKVNDLRTEHQASLATAPYQFEGLKSAMGWIVDEPADAAFPTATIYFARLELAADNLVDTQADTSKAAIAIGNTATEALSAHLASAIDPLNKEKIEEQLEALQLMPALEGQLLDTGSKFREARHCQGFKAVHAGTSYLIKPVTASSGAADTQETHQQEQLQLPIALAQALDSLNQLQGDLHTATNHLESWQEQLFSDWYKYMVAAYPPEDARDDFPDMDEVAYFIQQHSIPKTQEAQQNINKIRSATLETKQYLTQELENLQRLTVEDIKDWGTFLALLAGQSLPEKTPLETVFIQIKSAFSDALRSLLPTEPEQASSLTSGQKGEIVQTINTLIENDPTSLISPAGVQQLPVEARNLFTTGNQRLLLSEKRRLGRLILESAMPKIVERRPPYALEEVPAPRYWQPNEPVVLIADTSVKLTPRHGEDGRLREDGLLSCHLFQQDLTQDVLTEKVSELIAPLRARIDQLESAVTTGDEAEEKEHIGFYSWTSQPWHPFMMEWGVELFPLEENGSHTALDRQYKPEYIQTHYDFPEEGVDLATKNIQAALNRSANIYTGRSLMLDYAKPQLLERLEAYCTKHLAPLYYDAKKVAPNERLNKPPLDKITEWALANKEELSPFNQAVLAIQGHLSEMETAPIAQALSGFNAALLQHQQTLQLPIEDPLGFPDAKALAENVHTGVGRHGRLAPQPLNDFNPLRTGALRLQHLRLVDTFGRIQPFFDEQAQQTLVAAQSFTQIDGHSVLVPPRLVQPARINFDWLAAGYQDMKMNAHPATSPICGWLTPNYFHNSLLVYNELGELLGALERRGDDIRWSGAPGRTQRMLAEEISNPHLYRLVNHLLTENSHFLDDMLTAVESALENIRPANSAENESLALLVGRPLAVVRASLDLEIKGLPASNQDWNLFRQTLLTHRRETDNFMAVHFPLRIGEHSRLNDGLLGFWIENSHPTGQPQPYLDNKLYLPQTPDTPRTSSVDHPDLVMHRGSTVPHLQVALETPKQNLTMLVDPRGAVHISSGILPIRSLHIPPDQYVPALKNLEMTFHTGPFLTKTDGIELPLPTEPGFSWSLQTKENNAWSTSLEIDPVEQNASFSSTHMIREGWLKLKKEETNNI